MSVLIIEKRQIPEIIERMKKAINVNSDADLAKFLGLSETTVSKWKKRERIPEKNYLAFLNKTNVNPDWLLTGEGEMYKTDKIQVFDNENGIEVTYYPDVYASAGYGATNTLIEPQKVTLSKFIIDSFKIINPKRVDLIHIYGDSMEPVFQNGDIAVVERIDDISEVKNGDTIIANIDGDLFIKKIEKIPFQNAIILKSTNSLYKDIIVEDFDKFKVVAVVRGKFRVI